MKSKLGVYFIALGGIDVPGYLGTAQPRIVLSMEHSADTWRAAKQASPNTFIIGRHYVDDKDQIFLDDPEGRAEQFFAAMKGDAERMRGIYDAWMGYNESVVNSQEEAEKLSRFYVRWGDLMRAAGCKSAAYSFATGNPARGDPKPDGSLEPNFWPFLAEGLRHCDLLSLHEYSAPTLDFWATFLCLRYRKVMDLLPPDARRQIVITETGIDGGAGPADQPQQGWSKFTDAAGYVATLSWYDAELQKDDYVIGATIFTMNGWGIDGSFAIGDVTQIRDYIAQGGAPASVVVKPPVVVQPVAPVSPVPPVQPPTQPADPQPPVPLPTQSQTTYTVLPGDTLFVIARKFGTTVAAIVAANNISNPSLIRPGQTLKIPGAVGSPSPSVPPVAQPQPSPAPAPAAPLPPAPAPAVQPAPPATVPTLPQPTLMGPFPHFNLHDPCAQDPGNLIVNGSMGPANHDTPFGTVVNS
ncbi:MAG TPA: LysM domain-containing protein, partial [Anaerolineae bacterium]